jgi:hypothetical protein
MMKLRILHETVTSNTLVNNGSRKYPKMEMDTQVETTERLQFSEDGGVTWQDVPVVEEEWTRNE